MYRYEKVIYIERPRQEVWDFVSNPANNDKWTTAEPAAWSSDGPPGVGSTVREAAKVLGRLVESPTIITAWDPPSIYARKSLKGKIEWESRIELRSRGTGTEFSIVAEGKLRGFLKVLAGFAGAQARKNTDSDLASLKRLMESGTV